MSIIFFLLFGLVVGAIARFLVPGRDPMGLIATMILGVVGSLVGGLLGNLVSGGELLELDPAKFLGSLLGAIIALLAYRALGGGRRARLRR